VCPVPDAPTSGALVAGAHVMLDRDGVNTAIKDIT
jgi:hypothetical protein